jgi:V8-like Glu-specific endopeptidase
VKGISKALSQRVSLLVIASLVSIGAQAFDKRIKVIYGKDDRLDVFQVSDPAMLALADSTAAMIPRALLTEQNQSVAIQSNEPYFSQPNAAMCSGFLVGPDLLATAGHCISDFDCANNAFVFNYKMAAPGVNPVSAVSDDVYTCKKVIARELTRAQDYALIQLDRPVVGHQAVTLATTPAKAGDSLVLIGHPSGLPTKIAGGASVRKDETGYFVANTDSYGGNSGSAVFNATTREVVGILVRGEEDFKYDNAGQCTRSNYCADGDCRGEDATHIQYIIDGLKLVQ